MDQGLEGDRRAGLDGGRGGGRRGRVGTRPTVG
jgi:hypothetical protein